MNRRRFFSFLGVAPIAVVGAVVAAPAQVSLGVPSYKIDPSRANQAALDRLRIALSNFAPSATCDGWMTEDGDGALVLEVSVYTPPTISQTHRTL